MLPTKFPRHHPSQHVPGFTLVEMLVVISLIALLAAIALPALNSARQTARKSACQNNLRQIGMGLTAIAERDQRLCSGAFDWNRDGCVTEIGWVADLVNDQVLVGKMLCPSNTAKVSETFNDLLTLDTSAAGFLTCVDRLGSEPTTSPGGTTEMNPCRMIHSLGLAPGSEPRRRVVEERIFNKSYNTNYTASWFLVRSEALLDASGNLKEKVPGCGVGIRSRNSTRGPLRLRDLDNGKVAASQIPILGDGAPNGSLSMPLGKVNAASDVTLSFTKGPVLVTSMNPPSFPGGTPKTGAAGWWVTWAQNTRQDYRGFAPVHRGSCNILFADMSVRIFKDRVADGYLNNGFPASTASGFQSDVVEISDDDIESNYSLFDRHVQ
jgi:prepilin-type N-terminal cleavage/methylation domain-containing protein